MRCLLAIVLILSLGCRSARPLYQATVHDASYCARPNLASGTTENFTTTTAEGFYSIEDMVVLGLSESPDLKAAKHRIQALKHRVSQELALPDPVLNSTTHLAPVETAAGRQVFGLGLSQKYVRAEKRATQAAIVHDEVRSAEADLAKRERELAEQIRLACIQLMEVREIIRVTQADLAALAQFEEVVLGKYEVDANASQQEVLDVQIEQSNLENQIASLRQKERSYFARLARLAHLAPGSSFEIKDRLQDTANELLSEQLVAQALAARPELKSQWAQIQRGRKEICLAHLQHKPDFTVGLNWIATSSSGISPVANGDDALLLGVGFNLPISKERIRSAVSEATHASLASTLTLESIQDRIVEEVFDSIAKLDSSTAILELLREDILPKAERSLELSIEEYSAGKSDYAQVLDNWRSLLKYRLTEIRVRSNRMQQQATLARQVGQLEPMQPGSQVPESETSVTVAEQLQFRELGQ